MKIIPNSSVIKNNFTDTTVSVEDYYNSVLKGENVLALKPCGCDKRLKREVKDTMKTIIDHSIGTKEDIDGVDYDLLMSDLGNMNGISNDVLIMICQGDNNGR